MLRAHVDLLACPICSSELGLETEAVGELVEEGRLRCRGCPADYAVARGVPRFLDSPDSGSGRRRVDTRTRRSFGYEWLRYPVTTREEDLVTFFGLTGVEPELYTRVSFRNLFSHEPSEADVAAATTTRLRGKTVLDAGCGMGKYVSVVADLADTVIGLDASDAVERAHKLNAGRANVLIVQGDIFAPPLKPQLDLVYSVGVLHHTSDAHQAFLSLAGLVRTGGQLAVWLYPRGETAAQRFAEIWHERLLRPMTCRLPLPLLERLCALLGRLTVYKTGLMEGGGLGRNLARGLNLLAVGEHRDPCIAAFLNFDWYSPRYRSRHDHAQLAEWFAQAGFSDLRSLPVAVSAIARRSEPRPREAG